MDWKKITVIHVKNKHVSEEVLNLIQKISLRKRKSKYYNMKQFNIISKNFVEFHFKVVSN